MVINVSHIPGNFLLDASPRAAKETDCIDSRVRTISRGYVNVTEVMPAAPPQTSRRMGERSAPGEDSANYTAQVLVCDANHLDFSICAF